MAQIRLIWFALLISIGLYFVIAYLIIPSSGDQPLSATFDDTIVQILYLVAAITFVAAFPISSMMMRREPSPARTRLGYIVRWAMFESTAIYGLMAAMLRQNLRLFLPLATLAIAGMLFSYPRDESAHGSARLD
jgi:hypothetical protein